MAEMKPTSDATTIADYEARVRELEAELTNAKAEIVLVTGSLRVFQDSTFKEAKRAEAAEAALATAQAKYTAEGLRMAAVAVNRQRISSLASEYPDHNRALDWAEIAILALIPKEPQ